MEDMMKQENHQWTLQELQSLYHSPLMELVWQAQQVHQRHHRRWEIQVCEVISVKTGGCPEDCKYCGQSARYQTGVLPQPMMTLEEVKAKAKMSIANGTTRVCLSVAWREVRQGKVFDQILEMVRELSEMGVEVCCTLGMLKAEHAQQLAEAGLYSYNHNLDTSESFYPHIITSHTYQDRINTLEHVSKAGLGTCCGGIFGLGESVDDRLELIRTLANRRPQPHSVPLNQLVTIAGTPLENNSPVSFWEFLPLVAIARITLPQAMIRLSGGRLHLSVEQQALCFMAGANSIHSGEKLLVTPSPDFASDKAMFDLLGLTYRPPYACPPLQEDA
jgi:biotin synthase